VWTFYRQVFLSPAGRFFSLHFFFLEGVPPMERRSRNRGFTLVELLVVIAIIGVLVALLLPAIQAAREAARRNSCLNNMKQISLGLLNHESAKGYYPLASTAPFQFGTIAGSKIGSANQRVATGGSDGDGYSWLVLILPFMEQQPLYTQISTAPHLATGGVPNKLLAGPCSQNNMPIKIGGTGASIFTLQVETFKCPSYPGADDAKARIGTTNTMAVGNYVALASTHYNRDGQTPAGADVANEDSLFESKPGGKLKQIGGNGALAFWQRVTPADVTTNFTTLRGNSQASIRDGTSGTAWFTESRDENWSSWVSGYASYVVGADPAGPGKINKVNNLGALTPVTNPMMLGWANAAPGQTALNVGSGVKRAGGDAAANVDTPTPTDPTKQSTFYQRPFMHGADTAKGRWYGPSSAHSGGVVLHSYADGHGKSINESIERNTYLRIISRAGQEVIDDTQG
jgi:prepilin-type N-terminal cleavage/methylation domain-containing protein